MDEREYKAVYKDLNSRPCVFEKAMLARCVSCSQAHKVNIAVREAMGCGTEAAQSDCALFKSVLKRNARFVLQLNDLNQPLPHTKDLRMQCGGLTGLHALMTDPSRDPQLPDNDVRAWIVSAISWFDGLNELPYQEIAQNIAQFKGRERKRDKF